jgi:1-deoxy-D-xylulose-5-phosphate reductoisomerase
MTDNRINLAILGSTGSIGQQTLDIVRNNPNNFRVKGISAGKNTDLFYSQIDEFKPEYIYSLEKLDKPVNCKKLSLEELAVQPDIDLLIIATSGKAGIVPVLAAIRAGKQIAIANKEALVMAGEIIMTEAAKHDVQLRPVDSEHSAIWQCLNGESQILKLIITASGGPFYGYKRQDLENVSVEQTLNHPTWKMGKKVTVDSATLMNKGLEVIEAHWLFSVPYENIDLIIHPQSIIHSFVEFTDGSIKAQMSNPDMHMPIQYAMSYPERLTTSQTRPLDLGKTGQLVFKKVDYNDFPCLKLALKAGNTGGTATSALCAADETAVDLFLNNKIKFTDIEKIISEVLNAHKNIEYPSLDEIYETDKWARNKSLEIVRKGSLCY